MFGSGGFDFESNRLSVGIGDRKCAFDELSQGACDEESNRMGMRYHSVLKREMERKREEI